MQGTECDAVPCTRSGAAGLDDGDEFGRVDGVGEGVPSGGRDGSVVFDLGAGEILLTSMDRDGTGDGFDIELTRAISDAVDVPVIASGGVGNLQHLVDGIKQAHASAVLAASIFHFGTHTISEAKHFMAQQGVPVRLS